MKSLRFFALLCITLMPVAAEAVELRDATNQQILDELAYRLGGGGGGGGREAQILFTCDPYGYINVQLINDQGRPFNYNTYLGTRDACVSQSTAIAQTRSRISKVSLIALCDPYGYMKKLAARPEGALGELDSPYFGTVDECLRQAGPINRSFN